MGTSRSRQRQQRRKGMTPRAPGVWRGGSDSTSTSEERAVDHGVRQAIGVSWRAFSGLITLGLIIVLVLFFLSDVFYVRSIVVAGTNYLDKAEVFRVADIAEMHLFWINPSEVQERLEELDVVADVRVEVGWPPDMVKIYIEERQPAIMWVQSGVAALVDLQGRVLAYPPDDTVRPDLLRIITDGSLSGPPGLDDAIPEDAINGALQLQSVLAGIPYLRYNAENGLGFREEPGGWDVWLGIGTDMPNKLLVYEAIRDDLISRGITPVFINVANPEGAYYCGSIETCYE